MELALIAPLLLLLLCGLVDASRLILQTLQVSARTGTMKAEE
ncbi:TadE/TadG family type IV pilus assembly protein [Phenylobacterium sp. J367]|nr:TadE/TadG family type IV pilus assembly protein [Phenylobacterium sp. J367]MCR5879751.1 pilus assembly protein [Phenylobacterium sp. J367]